MSTSFQSTHGDSAPHLGQRSGGTGGFLTEASTSPREPRRLGYRRCPLPHTVATPHLRGRFRRPASCIFQLPSERSAPHRRTLRCEPNRSPVRVSLAVRVPSCSRQLVVQQHTRDKDKRASTCLSPTRGFDNGVDHRVRTCETNPPLASRRARCHALFGRRLSDIAIEQRERTRRATLPLRRSFGPQLFVRNLLHGPELAQSFNLLIARLLPERFSDARHRQVLAFDLDEREHFPIGFVVNSAFAYFFFDDVARHF